MVLGNQEERQTRKPAALVVRGRTLLHAGVARRAANDAAVRWRGKRTARIRVGRAESRTHALATENHRAFIARAGEG